MQVPPESITFQHYNGTISLFSPRLPEVHGPRGEHFPGHITLLTAAEYKSIGRPPIDTIISAISVDHIYLVGEGCSKNETVKWESVVWNAGDRWRDGLGLSRRFFHVTTSAGDDHSLNKGIQSVINRLGADGLVDRLENMSIHGMYGVFVSAWIGYSESEYGPPLFQFALSTRMITKYPQMYQGYHCLARCSLSPKIRMLAFAQALNLDPSLLPQTIKALQEPFECSFGPTISESERAQIPIELEAHLTRPWPEALYGSEAEDLHRILWLHTTPPRETIKFQGYVLPRNFSWIYPLRIAGMSTPRNEEDVDCLERMGVTDLLSLNKEGPLPRHWFKLKRIKHHQVMLENYAAPTCAEMDVIWEKVSSGGIWVIHCGGGVGRAGTVIACLMTMLGRGDSDKSWKAEDRSKATQGDQDGQDGEDDLSSNMPVLGSDEAIKLLRLARPKSIESDLQAAFVSKWVSHRWKLLSAPPPLIEPSHSLDKHFLLGDQIPASDLDNVILFLIGKPGSGKSFFSEMVTKRRLGNHPTIVISQDDCGSKEMCETEISREWPSKTLLIFDRCNPRSKDRKSWLKKVHPARRPIAIYFDFDKTLCKQRIDQRLGHPTIRAGRGVKALDEMDKAMESPSLNEGFKTIIRITSFTAAKELAVKWLTNPIPLRKFPRTPHLIDTGASTEDDLVYDIFPANGILEGNLTIEEKIDGANLGISLDHDLKLVIQNRSHLIHDTVSGQFKGMDAWLREHSTALFDILHRDPAFPERYILYGEWCQARHSIQYNCLADKFLAFDLYDRLSNTNCSRRVITKLLKGSGIAQAPFIKYSDTITKEEVLAIIQGRSVFASKPTSASKRDQSLSRMEGIYIRFEDPKRLICEARGKVVRSDFLAVDAKHWSRTDIMWNRTRFEAGESELRDERDWDKETMTSLGPTEANRAGSRGRIGALMETEDEEGKLEEMGKSLTLQ